MAIAGPNGVNIYILNSTNHKLNTVSIGITPILLIKWVSC